MATLARRTIKTVLFLLLSIAIGRLIGDPYRYISFEFANGIANRLHGISSPEQLDDVYFYINMVVILVCTIAVWWLAGKIISYVNQKRRG